MREKNSDGERYSMWSPLENILQERRNLIAYLDKKFSIADKGYAGISRYGWKRISIFVIFTPLILIAFALEVLPYMFLLNFMMSFTH